MTNQALASSIRDIKNPLERRQAAKVFLEFFRLLRYLDFADPEHTAEENLKNAILVFSLITSGRARLLLGYLERRVLRGMAPEGPVYQLYDSFVYCIPYELKKVINTELTDISVARQADNIRRGREQPRYPQGLLPAVGGAAGAGVRPAGAGPGDLPNLPRRASSSPWSCARAWALIRSVRDFEKAKDTEFAVRRRRRSPALRLST